MVDLEKVRYPRSVRHKTKSWNCAGSTLQIFVCPKKKLTANFFCNFWANFFFSKKNFWQKFSFSRFFLFFAKYSFFFVAKFLLGKKSFWQIFWQQFHFFGEIFVRQNFCLAIFLDKIFTNVTLTMGIYS